VPKDEELQLWIAYFRSRPIPERLLQALAQAPLLSEADPALCVTHPGGLVDRRRTRLLSKSERIALFLASHGIGVQRSADLLGKGYTTVQRQRRTARIVLNAKNTTHAVAVAIRTGQI